MKNQELTIEELNTIAASIGKIGAELLNIISWISNLPPSETPEEIANRVIQLAELTALLTIELEGLRERISSRKT